MLQTILRGDVRLAMGMVCFAVFGITINVARVQSAAVLTSHWALNEGTGTTTRDSAVSRSGTLQNGATWTTGRSGAAISLDGRDDYVSLPNLDVSGSAISLTSWVKISNFPSMVDQRFIVKSTDSTEQSHYWMLGTTGNRLRFRLKAGGSTTTLVAASGNLSTNTWYHAAATYDGTTMRLYLNGTLVGSVAKAGSLSVSSTVPVNIGRSPDGTNYMSGAIDDVRIYSSALTQTEVASLASTPSPATPTSPTPSPTPTTNILPTVSLTSPWDGVTYEVGSNITVSATAGDTDGTIAKVDFYAGSTLIGSDTTSKYSISWRNVKAGTYVLTAVARDNKGGSTISAPRTVKVGSSTSTPTNSPPSVSLTAPASGATFTAPATITLSASAGDTDGTIAKVEFYSGTTRIGTDTTSPYSYSWSSVAAGSYTLKAVATDNAGATTSSATRTVTVSAPSSSPSPTNTPPSVSLTSPAAGASFIAPATITLSATASDTGGSIARVEFYRGTTLIASDTTSPYSYSWTNVAAGTYSIKAVAYDNAGAMTQSSTRDITVTSATMPTKAVFTPSSNHSTAVDRYVIEIFTAGADTRAANPVASRDIGKPSIVSGVISADISSTIMALSPGNYVATVTAFGDGGSTQSAASPQFTR